MGAQLHMSMAYVPVTLEGSVVSGETKETQGYPSVRGIFCVTLSNC